MALLDVGNNLFLLDTKICNLLVSQWWAENPKDSKKKQYLDQPHRS
jgi:hypothetical protein